MQQQQGEPSNHLASDQNAQERSDRRLHILELHAMAVSVIPLSSA